MQIQSRFSAASTSATGSGGINPAIARTLKQDFGSAAISNLKTDPRVQTLNGYLTQGWEGPIPKPLDVLNGGPQGPWQARLSSPGTYVYTLGGKDKNSDQTITFDSREGVTTLDSERIRSTVGLADTIRETLQLDGQGNVTKPNDDAIAFGLPMD